MQARDLFLQAQEDLVQERMQLVELLHGFATGSAVDEDQALAASGGLRVNIMKEGGCIWLQS